MAELVKCLVWSIALYGSETWTIRRAEEMLIDSVERWLWRRMERICWRDRVTNEKVLDRVDEQRSFMKNNLETEGNGR